MKINIQKCFRWVTSLCAIAAVVLTLIPSPASAAVEVDAIDPADYVTDVVADGVDKTVYYTFDGFSPLFVFRATPTGLIAKYDTMPTYFQAPDGSTSMSCDFYWFGVEPPGGVMPTSGVLDVTDLCAGATVTFVSGYSLRVSSLNYFGGPYQIRAMTSIYCFDADGNPNGQIFGDYTYVPVAEAFNVNINKSDTFTLPDGTAYIIPRGYWSISADDDNVRPLVVQMSLGSFCITTGVNMVLDQSETMEQVKDALEEGNKLQQETNDKLDQMIDNAPEQQEEADRYKDEIAEQGQIVDDALAEKDELLEMPDPGDVSVDLDDYVDPYYRGQMTNVFAAIMSLQFPASMMAAVCGIILVSYVLFGKK